MKKNQLDLLIVEDSSNDVHMMTRVFQKENIELDYEWVKDGQEALDFLTNPKLPLPTVVLLDIKLPKVDGLEVLKKVRSDERFTFLPVVIYSSSSQYEDIREAYENGANSYLTKPASYAELKGVMKYFTSYWLRLNKTFGND